MTVGSAIKLEPITGSIGVEISGVDLSKDLSNRTREEIYQAFLKYNVLFFRDQELTPAQLLQFASQFGTPGEYPFVKHIDGYPQVIEILKTESDTINFGGNWHSDTTYMETPFLGTVLYALETPLQGGDTQFANLSAAYTALSEAMREMLQDLRVVNSSAQDRLGGRAKKMAAMNAMKETYVRNSEPLEAVHPLIRTHPETGSKSLYISPSHAVRFEGMTDEESRPLIDYLCAHAVKSEFLCRFRWRPGSVAVWDNRCTLHQAINDYGGSRRRMHRVTLEGDRPA